MELVKTPLSAPLHTSLNGSAQTLLPTYSALPIMPGFITPTHTHTHTASPAAQTPAVPTANDWNNYYYVSVCVFLVQVCVRERQLRQTT